MNRSKILYAIMLLLYAQVFVVTTQAQTTPADIFNFPEIDFATPEEAIEHFVASIAKNDLTGALQAFAINEYAEKFDFTAQSKRLRAIDLYQGLAPAEYPMYAQLNHLSLLSRYALYIKFFGYGFYSTEPLDDGLVGPIEDEGIAAFTASVNPKQLTKLMITRMFRFTVLSEKLRQLWQEQVAISGAEESTEFVVLYKLDGNYFVGGLHLLRYGQAWKIDSLGSILASTPALGVVTKTTLTGFDELISRLEDSEDWKLEEILQ
jgi:hypothetical protein